MTNEERMRKALLVLAGNLRGSGFDSRPVAYEMCCKLADFATAIANGDPWPEFDSGA